MKHKSNLGLYEYWNSRRGDQKVPLRGRIEPAQIQTALPNVFVLDRTGDRLVFRLAGTAVCSLFGRELRESGIETLWQPQKIGIASALLKRAYINGVPVALTLNGESQSGRSVELEMLLLPLASQPGLIDRFLGSVNPLSKPYWLHLDPVVALQTLSGAVLEPPAPDVTGTDLPGPGPMAVYRSRRAGSDVQRLCTLTVIEGGRR